MGDVPQGSVLGLVLLNIFTYDIDDEIQYTLSVFADDIELSGAFDTAERRDDIQRVFAQRESSGLENPRRFNIAKSAWAKPIPDMYRSWEKNCFRVALLGMT